ncbi:hypothetical protein [Photobacterium kasasachensis]|uniref:hypothetical protein n=1 Tax=Photobacterium kasasachensis TaxID=2910240 RepID=UPI003D0A9B16
MINEVSTKLLVLSMDMEAYKQQVAAVNVANVNTNGYSAQSVNFDSVLRQISTSRDRAQFAMNIDLYRTMDLEQLADVENNAQSQSVMLDEEILASTQASGKYQAMAELLNRRLGLIRMGIKGQ